MPISSLISLSPFSFSSFLSRPLCLRLPHTVIPHRDALTRLLPYGTHGIYMACIAPHGTYYIHYSHYTHPNQMGLPIITHCTVTFIASIASVNSITVLAP